MLQHAVSRAACSCRLQSLQHALNCMTQSLAACSHVQHAVNCRTQSLAACSCFQSAVRCSMQALAPNEACILCKFMFHDAAGCSCGGCQLIPVTHRCAGHSAVSSAAADRPAVASVAAKSQASCKPMPATFAASRHGQDCLEAVHRFCMQLAGAPNLTRVHVHDNEGMDVCKG